MSIQTIVAESLKGKIALITGCSGGIGSATALALAQRGCSIAVHYHSAQTKADTLVRDLQTLGVRAAAFQADLSSYDGVRGLHKEVVEAMGHPDVLFNNAGRSGTVVGATGDIDGVDVEEFEETWRVNTGASFLLTQLCIPHMVEQQFGRIVFCSSVAAGTGGVIGPHYASSKSALHGLLHWIANRYAKDGITCNAVAPALVVETSMMANPSDQLKVSMPFLPILQAASGAALPAHFRESIPNAIEFASGVGVIQVQGLITASHEPQSRIPVGRFGLPQEIASVVEMLVSNAYMTNKIVVADGGWTPSAF